MLKENKEREKTREKSGKRMLQGKKGDSKKGLNSSSTFEEDERIPSCHSTCLIYSWQLSMRN